MAEPRYTNIANRALSTTVLTLSGTQTFEVSSSASRIDISLVDGSADLTVKSVIAGFFITEGTIIAGTDGTMNLYLAGADALELTATSGTVIITQLEE